MINQFSTILLDMNQTFMFGGDRFSATQDYSIVYRQLGGAMEPNRVNQLICAAYDYLDVRYPNPKYQESFPSLREAFEKVAVLEPLSEEELDLLVETFARHELGAVSPEYTAAIHQLSKHYRLGLVIDIWAPKTLWVETLERCDILSVCESASFSSDLGMVKPSPFPFLSVLEEMQVEPRDAVMVGDSVRRDLGGAAAAGMDCILVGGAKHPSALGAVDNLIGLIKLMASDS